jgi:hypothetical protein
MTSFVYEAFGWLNMLAAIAGAVACLVLRRRSQWSYLVMAGFAGEAAVSVLHRALSFAVSLGATSYNTIGPVYMMLAVFGFAAYVVVIAGVVAILAERPDRIS